MFIDFFLSSAAEDFRSRLFSRLSLGGMHARELFVAGAWGRTRESCDRVKTPHFESQLSARWGKREKGSTAHSSIFLYIRVYRKTHWKIYAGRCAALCAFVGVFLFVLRSLYETLDDGCSCYFFFPFVRFWGEKFFIVAMNFADFWGFSGGIWKIFLGILEEKLICERLGEK